ncbi:MAG: polysaccharide biosynthesis/export family protein [Acidobacteria bacterium]|nr:polysaccharide biosynthesis/export family protein [Acidobacteriota bacterium]
MKTITCVSLSVLILLSTTSAWAQAPSSPPANPPRVGSTTALGMTADYRMVPGDKLRIEVYKDTQLSQSLQVRPDGKITLPLIGDVPAAGATPRELASTLTERLREFLNAPVVTVIVAEAVPPMVYVIGEVNTPGAQPLASPITVLQALSVAGGFKDFANPKKIRILRKKPDGTIQTISFNYKDAIKSAGAPMMLQPGDTVIVP